MPLFNVQPYVTAQQRTTAVTAAQALAAICHKLLGGNRIEPVDLASLTPAQLARAQAKQTAGTLARTRGYSVVLEDMAASEIRVPLGDDIDAALAQGNGTLLSAGELATLNAAIAGRVERNP